MINTEILYSAMNKPDVENLEEIRGQCFLCNKSITEGVKIKKILSGNFTNFTDCKNLKGTHICKSCSASLKDVNLRRNSFVCDKNKLILLKKNDLENYLFNLDKYLTEKEFIIGITTSFKKHNSFRCKVNFDYKRYYIREEDKEYIFEVDKLKKVYDMLNEAYLNFSKDELQTGNYNFISMEQFGLEKFLEFEKVFKEFRGTHQFNLLLYILNSEKRNEYVKAKVLKEKERLKEIKKIKKKV